MQSWMPPTPAGKSSCLARLCSQATCGSFSVDRKGTGTMGPALCQRRARVHGNNLESTGREQPTPILTHPRRPVICPQSHSGEAGTHGKKGYDQRQLSMLPRTGGNTLLKVLSFMKCRKKGHASHWLAWGRAGTMPPNFKLSNLGTSLMPEESWVHRRCQGGLREHTECWRAPNTDKTW